MYAFSFHQLKLHSTIANLLVLNLNTLGQNLMIPIFLTPNVPAVQMKLREVLAMPRLLESNSK
jgi:hypothetical protein